MSDKKEPKQLHLTSEIDFSELELKLVQPCNLGFAQRATRQILEKAREIAKINGFDYYMFVESIRDENFSRPGLLGNIHYYNQKGKPTKIHPYSKNRDN